MVTIDSLRDIALALPEVSEEPHFEKTSFKVRKKIFATYDTKDNIMNVKLSLSEQDVFSVMSKNSIYPIDNKWGLQGWTSVEIQKTNIHLLIDVMTAAYCRVAPQKLASLVRSNPPA